MPELHEILRSVVAADQAAGTPDTFVLTWVGGGDRVFVGHRGWTEDAYVPTDVEIDEMADRGWIRITDHGAGSKRRKFSVREAGREQIRNLDVPSRPEGVGVDLRWSAVGPVLTELLDQYAAANAPSRGVASQSVIDTFADLASASAAMRELARSPYVDVVFEGGGDVPMLVRPTILALQRERGWPAGPGEEIVSGLVAALGEEIKTTTDETRRSALRSARDGLMSSAWRVAVDYFERKTGI